jgi:hypothetical protein
MWCLASRTGSSWLAATSRQRRRTVDSTTPSEPCRYPQSRSRQPVLCLGHQSFYFLLLFVFSFTMLFHSFLIFGIVSFLFLFRFPQIYRKYLASSSIPLFGFSKILYLTSRYFIFFTRFFMYFIQHCITCRPSYSTVWEDAEIEPSTYDFGIGSQTF